MSTPEFVRSFVVHLKAPEGSCWTGRTRARAFILVWNSRGILLQASCRIQQQAVGPKRRSSNGFWSYGGIRVVHVTMNNCPFFALICIYGVVFIPTLLCRSWSRLSRFMTLLKGAAELLLTGTPTLHRPRPVQIPNASFKEGQGQVGCKGGSA